jgi:hypothetical protein
VRSLAICVICEICGLFPRRLRSPGAERAGRASLRAAKVGIVRIFYSDLPSRQRGAEYPAISLITRQAIQKALTGQSSVDAALDDAAAQVKKVDLSK